MKKKTTTNELAINAQDIKKQLEEELHTEQLEVVRSKIKKLMKEIRMTEIVLEKKKKALDEYLSGSIEFNEEQVYFQMDD